MQILMSIGLSIAVGIATVVVTSVLGRNDYRPMGRPDLRRRVIVKKPAIEQPHPKPETVSGSAQKPAKTAAVSSDEPR